MGQLKELVLIFSRLILIPGTAFLLSLIASFTWRSWGAPWYLTLPSDDGPVPLDGFFMVPLVGASPAF